MGNICHFEYIWPAAIESTGRCWLKHISIVQILQYNENAPLICCPHIFESICLRSVGSGIIIDQYLTFVQNK